MRKIIAIALLGLSLSACGGEPMHSAGTPVARPSPSPSRTDPGITGCRKLQDLGLSGVPSQYFAIAGEIAGTGDARLAEAAVTVYSSTALVLHGGTTREQQLQAVSDVLDLAEECLRVTG